MVVRVRGQLSKTRRPSLRRGERHSEEHPAGSCVISVIVNGRNPNFALLKDLIVPALSKSAVCPFTCPSCRLRHARFISRRALIFGVRLFAGLARTRALHCRMKNRPTTRGNMKKKNVGQEMTASFFKLVVSLSRPDGATPADASARLSISLDDCGARGRPPDCLSIRSGLARRLRNVCRAHSAQVASFSSFNPCRFDCCHSLLAKNRPQRVDNQETAPPSVQYLVNDLIPRVISLQLKVLNSDKLDINRKMPFTLNCRAAFH